MQGKEAHIHETEEQNEHWRQFFNGLKKNKNKKKSSFCKHLKDITDRAKTPACLYMLHT